MTKEYDIETISKRTQRAFGIPMIEITGTDDIDIGNLVKQLNKAAVDSWLLYLAVELKLANDRGVTTQQLQLLEDICWVESRIKEISYLTGPFGCNKFLRRMEIKGYKLFDIWILAYADLLENDITYTECCNEQVVPLVINRLTDLVMSGKGAILDTKFFAPISLVKIVEELLTILKSDKKNKHADSIKRLKRVLSHLKTLI